MKAALTQMNIVWEDKDANKGICERLARNAAAENAKLIIFPEMTLTGFTMRGEKFGEDDLENGETVSFFKQLSKKYDIAILFGMIYREKNKKPYNKAIMIQGDTILSDYSKLHPFSYSREDEYYGKGDNIVSAAFNNIRLGIFICYDLRFPEIFQISSKKNNVIAVIANWPMDRVRQWNVLLKARAIENQSFIIGVNRVGNGNGIDYVPCSAVYSPYGDRLTKETDDELVFADINADEAKRYREVFPVKRDRREKLYKKYYG
ncbi:MAG: nitrilase-related carbon-nitrogen hydrolase [Lachnospiraceae bacterium]